MARVWPFGLVLGVSNNVSVRIWLGLKHLKGCRKKGGGVRTPWTPPLDPPLIHKRMLRLRVASGSQPR